jgi:type I restriction enzyme R subunit
LLELYEEIIKKYQNKILTAAQVIEELLNLAKEIRETNKEPEQIGLAEYEYAFYTAVADNKSALELMGKEKLRELATVLFQEVRKNATTDWTIRENVKAKLRVAVKRILREYGYPPICEN